MTSNIEELKRAEDHALNPLQPSTLRNRIKRRIDYLYENSGDIVLIAYLQRSFDLLNDRDYRVRVKNIKSTMKSISNEI